MFVRCGWVVLSSNDLTSRTQIRRPIGTVFEIVLPILAVLFIVVLR